MTDTTPDTVNTSLPLSSAQASSALGYTCGGATLLACGLTIAARTPRTGPGARRRNQRRKVWWPGLHAQRVTALSGHDEVDPRMSTRRAASPRRSHTAAMCDASSALPHCIIIPVLAGGNHTLPLVLCDILLVSVPGRQKRGCPLGTSAKDGPEQVPVAGARIPAWEVQEPRPVLQ